MTVTYRQITRLLVATRGEIALASADQDRATDRLEWSTRMYKKGYVSKATNIADKLTLDKSKFELEKAQSAQNVLLKYTKEKTIKELRAEVEKATADELSKKSTWELEKTKEAKLERQIKACVLTAPADGIVVYANDPGRNFGSNTPQIEEGATVRERQKIFSLPDIGNMQVNAKIHESQIDKILENIKTLETEGLISNADNYSGFLRDIALEVANRAEIREQQRKEIKRLNQTLRNLRKHQKYLTDQIQQYNDYLQDCRLKHYQPKTKKKKKKKGENPNKIGPFKFSYSALDKKGVIIDSEVPAISRKKTSFYISSEAVGVFDIVAKIGGVQVDKMTLELDDLLEKNYNNITQLELDQVILDVNMTIHLINKFFLK